MNVATIPQAAVYTFQSQARQFPRRADPGIGYERNTVTDDDGRDWPVDCLTYRNRKGVLIGILYHYPDGGPSVVDARGIRNRLEHPGSMNLYVREDRKRRGIGTRLVTYAEDRWGVDPNRQRYSPEGAEFMARLLRDGVIPPAAPRWLIYAIASEGDGEPVEAFLRSFDPDYQPDGYDGPRSGRAEFTHDPLAAVQFASVEDALATWKAQSTRVPLRPDGKPNRPLTAFTVEVVRLSPEPN